MSEQTMVEDDLTFSDEPPRSYATTVPAVPGGAGKPSGNNGPVSTSIDMLMDVRLQVSVELGRARLSVRQVLDLQKGSVVELDRMAGDAVDVFVNDHLIARGEVVVVDDKFGVRISQLVTNTKESGGS
jgi:flagellar motor switch protein FliN/FliY